MKLTKSLFLAFAGLGLFACSNEEVVDNNGSVDGVKNISVTLNLPKAGTDMLSRAFEEGIAASDATQGSGTVPVTINRISVTLHSANGNVTQTYTAAADNEDDFSITSQGNRQTAELSFQSVRNPISIEVSVNGGSTDKLTLDGINGMGLAAQLYKEVPASQFQPNGEDALKVTVTPSPRYARLELSGISRAPIAEGNQDIFNAATLAGMYLTGVYTDEDKTSIANADNGWSAQDNKPAADYSAPTWSRLGGSFVAASASWPESGKAYAYNIFEGMPSLVFALTDVTLKNNVIIPSWDKLSPIYAKVGKFVTESEDSDAAGIKNGVINTFKPGYIYRITSIAIPDYVWGTNPEEGGSEITLTATVVVEPWNIVDGSASWGNN